MLTAFLEDTLRRFGGRFDQLAVTAGTSPACAGTIALAVEHVVDGTSARLRAVPNYARRLQEPVIGALSAIDAIVDQVPGVLSCQRSTFATDPYVNAFFADHGRLREVFSTSKEVRELFDRNLGADECFALLCMHREERTQLGMGLIGDRLRKDVMQTTLGFSDHQLVAPGLDEAAARRALKCCVCNCLIDYIGARSTQLKNGSSDIVNRGRALRGRLRREPEGTPEHAVMERQLEGIDAELDEQGPRLTTLEDQMCFVIDSLKRAHEIIVCRQQTLFVDRLGIQHSSAKASNVNELRIAEIQVAEKPPRVATLVSFPRSELLPARDFLLEASLFLAA